MHIKNYKSNFTIFLLSAFLFLFLFENTSKIEEHKQFEISKMRSSGSPKASAETKKARGEYFFKLMRDPATNQIPADVNKRERDFLRGIKSKGLSKTNLADLFEWSHAGPNDVGGRTRALAVDVRNPDIVIAGGVSGGIWKSTNGGGNFSWQLKSSLDHVLSISYIAQDTRDGHQDTWYAGTGEITGNSASAVGAPFRGAGIYKSVDNGESWELLPKPGDDPLAFDHALDYVSKIDVSPTTGSVFATSNSSTNFTFGGVYKSEDGGLNFERVLETNSRYAEFDININGDIVAILSEAISANVSGVWLSTDDGTTWEDITPNSWPVGTDYRRTVLDFSTSNPNVLYTLTEVSNGNNDHRLHKFDISSKTAEDRSANIPVYTFSPTNIVHFNSQGSYNLLIAVKPDDENLVLIGGTNLHRSFDGFATAIDTSTDSGRENSWLGGYDNNDGNGSELNSHPDIHSFAFDPNDPNNVWIGNDGGLNYTEKIAGIWPTARNIWRTKNVGYNVTQSYHISIPDEADASGIMTGTQDNGTQFFTFTGTPTILDYDPSTGDGGFSYFGDNFAYVSTQLGSMLRVRYDPLGRPLDWFGSGGPGANATDIAFIHPTSNLATGQLFINPFTINPNNENIMYYPAGSLMLRNTRLGLMPTRNTVTGNPWDGTDVNWVVLEDLEAPTGYIYSSLNFSRENSRNVLYFAASSLSSTPIIYRLDDAHSSTGPAVDISIPDLASGAWVQDIAINPENSDEVIVVASNYNIVGLYRTTDGGSNWEAIEGTLQGDDQKGPSLRSATILPVDNGNIYLVGTTAGLFSTAAINGDNTTWTQESTDLIGNVVIQSIASRTADSYVAVGSHGRGVFVGTAKELVVDVDDENGLPTEYNLSQNYPNPFNPSTKIRYSLPAAGNVKLSVYNINGEEVAQLLNTSQPAGNYEAEWNGRNLSGQRVASGIYFYTLTSENFVQTKKMILLK